ncbi:MAG: dihydrolipoyl dehydrogenase [Clostridia bacterium]|jgi:dihydrolipoamide dehydrogenase|nr:dihydrolipoyl dehydrogenase [Clostridia bacterium]MBT7122398.1 dihydrolipoyl dehydrogenase [Clostridia bacterium]
MIYDLIVIGAGPAGYLGAERAGHAGLQTLLFEKRNVGGVCLNEGCIPTKSLLYSAKIKDNADHGEKYGVTVTGAKLDHKAVIARKNKVVKTLVGGVSATLKANKVTVINAEAKITGKTADGYTVTDGAETYTAKKLLIAVGSVPAMPPIPGLKESVQSGYALTSREMLDIEAVPDNLVVIGGGVIGLEMASYFKSAGSNVTIIEMLPTIGGPIDKDIAGILLKNLKKKGIDFKLNCTVTAIKDNIEYKDADGNAQSIDADKVLLSIGRRPMSESIGLETIGVLAERGAIVTDSNLQTNLPGVYAAGDVNGKSLLAHTAYREAEVAVTHMLGNKDTMRYSAIAGVIYTTPEVAGVGMTGKEAAEAGIDIIEKSITMNYSGRYLAENDKGNGIIKLVVDKKWNKLIGVHMISNYASEIIYGAAMMIEKEMTIDEIKQLIFPHPTVGEALREAIFQL